MEEESRFNQVIRAIIADKRNLCFGIELGDPQLNRTIFSVKGSSSSLLQWSTGDT
jgi:hypothetical protein